MFVILAIRLIKLLLYGCCCPCFAIAHEVKFIKLFKYSCYKYVSYSVNRNSSPSVLKWYERNGFSRLMLYKDCLL